ncbi:MAG: hypothetical protein IH800_05295 [Myxococcales bacterium]|nr:hypothetical protein [Myxococcales bacterium]MCZ6714705.1 hypothetical protein [Deltaproteobacteria bacterium]MCZ6822715.1 hypothetical protein [Deltaproteobacteria bacterium]
MTTEPTKLRRVPAPGELESKAPPRARRGRPSGPEIALALALVVALAVLIWSRVQLGDQIDVLRGQTRALQAAVAERERVIDAQTDRLEDVRTHVDRLGELLNRPLPGIPD